MMLTDYPSSIQNYYYQFPNFKAVFDFATSIVTGKKLANNYQKKACQRFLDDLKNPQYILKPKKAEFCIHIIESTLVHVKSDTVVNEPFLLLPFQKFIIYNLTVFYLAHDETERRYKEGFIYIPRKNGKTTLIAAISFALSMLEIVEGRSSELFVVATKLSRAKESFDFILKNINKMGIRDEFRVLDNNQESSISRSFNSKNGQIDMKIQAIAANAEKNDGILCNIFVLDELHSYKNANDYIVYRQATKSFKNRMVLGITTAGTNMFSFCYERLNYCKEILDKKRQDEQYFIFICEADESEHGDIDYLSPIVHEMANPCFNVTIRPEDMMNEALQAQGTPSSRHLFLNKSLNVYTNTANSWFDLGEVQYSDELYNYTIEELVKLPIVWYGSSDLSVRYDLTAAVLYGRYIDEKKNIDVDVVISRGFMPITQAKRKAEEDNIPFFYWQENDWLTLCNSDVVEYEDVVKWFVKMRKMGFNIKNVVFDKYQSREFERSMKQQKFKMFPASQQYWMKSEAFREIERRIKEKKFYYLHSKAYEYCISNVKGNVDAEDRVRYEKVNENSRMDLFDASVMACKSLIIESDKKKLNTEFFNQQL